MNIKYNITGEAIVTANGTISLENFKLTPITDRKLEASLPDIWIPESKLSFETFIHEMERNGLVNLSAKQVKACYLFLSSIKAVRDGLAMTTVMRAFAGSMKLRFKDERSLHGDIDTDLEEETFKRVFRNFVSEKPKNEHDQLN